jgi:heme O synthase-like polyprenyltransferase
VSISVTGVFKDVGGQQGYTQFFTALTIVTVVIAILPLFIIFLYKNRRRQLILCYVAILLIIGYSYWMAQTVKGIMGSTQIDTHNWGIGLFLTSISILLIIFAIKAIQRDEKLVKSADRLR